MPIEEYEFKEGDDRLTNGHGMINWHALDRGVDAIRTEHAKLSKKLGLPEDSTFEEIRAEFSRRAHLPNKR